MSRALPHFFLYTWRHIADCTWKKLPVDLKKHADRVRLHEKSPPPPPPERATISTFPRDRLDWLHKSPWNLGTKPRVPQKSRFRSLTFPNSCQKRKEQTHVKPISIQSRNNSHVNNSKSQCKKESKSVCKKESDFNTRPPRVQLSLWSPHRRYYFCNRFLLWLDRKCARFFNGKMERGGGGRKEEVQITGPKWMTAKVTCLFWDRSLVVFNTVKWDNGLGHSSRGDGKKGRARKCTGHSSRAPFTITLLLYRRTPARVLLALPRTLTPACFYYENISAKSETGVQRAHFTDSLV